VPSFTRELKAILKQNGCAFFRQGRGDHEIWQSPINGKKFTVDGKILSRHTANGILKQAGIDKAF